MRPLIVLVALVAALPAGARPTEPLRVAALELKVTGAVDARQVDGVASLVVAALGARPDVQVISGADLRALLGLEQRKALLGCSDDGCLAQIGGALGVQYLVESEVSQVGDTFVLSLVLLDATRAKAVARVAKRSRTLGGLADLAEDAARELERALPAGPAPARSGLAVGLVVGGGAAVALGAASYGLAWRDYFAAKSAGCDEACASRGNLLAGLGVGGLAAGGLALVLGLVLPSPAAGGGDGWSIVPGPDGVMVAGRF